MKILRNGRNGGNVMVETMFDSRQNLLDICAID